MKKKKYVKMQSPRDIKQEDLARVGFIKKMFEEGTARQEHLRRVTTLPPDWGKIERRIRGRDKGRCCLCNISPTGKKNEVLVVHHKDENQGNIEDSNLLTLCHACHDKLPVGKLSERFYCKTVVHEWYKPVCCKLGWKAGYRDSKTCEFFLEEHGCIVEALGYEGRKDV